MLLEHNNYSVGIDISDQSVKMVQLKKKRGKPILVSYNYKSIPKGMIERGIIQNKKKFSEYIKNLLEKPIGKRIQTKKIVVNVPEEQTFTKIISVPIDKEENLYANVLNETSKHIPMNLDESYLDWQVTGILGKEQSVFVAAGPKKIADDFADAIIESGCEPIVFEVESVAILRALGEKTFSSPTLVIDFGHSKSNVAIADKNSLDLTMSIPLSGDTINQTVSQKLKLTVEQAEKAKIQCGLDKEKCKGALRIVLDAALDDLAYKLNDAIEFYAEKHGGSKSISTIIITGGGANFLNIEEVLGLKTKKTVAQGNGLLNINEEDAKALFKKKGVSPHFFTLAIGLALRGFAEKTI